MTYGIIDCYFGVPISSCTKVEEYIKTIVQNKATVWSSSERMHDSPCAYDDNSNSIDSQKIKIWQ